MIFLGLTPKRYAPLGANSSTDADAQAFIDAAGITDATQKSAVNQLVLDLKSALIWTKMKAIYPIVGGTATTHKWNLKDPRDLDAAFRLSFSTGWTHASTGMTPNGSSAYSSTFLAPATGLSLNSAHLSYYSRTNVNLTQVEIGSQNTNGLDYTIIEARTTNLTYYLVNSTLSGTYSAADTDSKAFYLTSRTASNVVSGFRNSTKLLSSTTASTNRPAQNIFIGAMNNQAGSPQFYSSKECAFASIGDGLTDTEAANFYTAVNTYQTTLGRNV
jgi:hypothetical protein